MFPTGQIGLVSADRKVVDWTSIRAAMDRQDNGNIILKLLKKLDLEEERKRTFESGYGNMNLCAFYEGCWDLRLAEILVEKGFSDKLRLFRRVASRKGDGTFVAVKRFFRVLNSFGMLRCS